MSHKESKKLRQMHRKATIAASLKAHNETRGMIEDKIAGVDKRISDGIQETFEKRLVKKPRFFPGVIWRPLQRLFVRPASVMNEHEVTIAGADFRANGTDPVKRYDGAQLHGDLK